MSGSSKQSLSDMAKLISQDFTDNERQFAGNLTFMLDGRISERREIAKGGDASSNINSKISTGIKATALVTETSVGTVAGVLLAGVAGLGAVASAGVGVLTAAAVAGTTYAVVNALETRPKNRIKGKAEKYKDYFPRDNDTIKLFSQLVALSITKELQAIPLRLAAQPTTLQSFKKTVDNTKRVIAAKRKVSRQENQQIKKLVKKEFDEIWDIFKKFTRNKDVYTDFKVKPWASQIAGLVANHCDLGDPTDRSEIVNDREINTLWINIFSRYLEGKDEPVRKSIMSTLGAKLNVMPEIPSSAPLTRQSSFSSGTSMSSDSLYSPRFFAPKVAVLAANQPELEQNAVFSARL